jgi:hypothetical protein
MTADEFVKIVRGGNEKLRVDEVVVNTGSQELHGKGILEIRPDEIEVRVTINKGENVPEVRSGIYTKSDAWTLTGLIDDRLHFKCDNVGPIGKRQHLWPGHIIRCTFDLHPIDLIPSGWDAMSREQRKNFLKEEHAKNPQIDISGFNTEGTEDDVSFYATLFEYPLLATKWGTEVKGETRSFDFILTKEGENSDLRISLRSKKGYQTSSEEEDWVKFHAFMNALAFTNGIHAWPYRTEYWRAGQKKTDRVTCAHRLAKTSHAPFNDNLAFQAQTGSLKWDFQDAIRKAADFFETNSALSKEISEILFLFREADASVHSEITIIALCTLFENLVRLLFRELDLKNHFKNEDVSSFDHAKAEILDEINRRIVKKGEGYRRLQNFIRSAQPFSMEQMFRAVVAHLGLKWEEDMEKTFKTWKRARHPIAHEKRRAEMPENKIKESIIQESQVAGAINILLLKLFGYSGYVRHSAFEEGYRQI